MESKINLTTVKPVNYKVTAALINQVPLPSQEPEAVRIFRGVTSPTGKQLHTPREATKNPAAR